MPRPTLRDLLNNTQYEPQAYDRFTRRPVHFVDGPFTTESMLPATGLYTKTPREIFVSNQDLFGNDRTDADKNETLKHEVLHSIFNETNNVLPNRLARELNASQMEAEHVFINLLLGNMKDTKTPEEVFTNMQRTPVPSRDELNALTMIRRMLNFKGGQ